MIATRHIGKESNDWETQAVLGLRPDAQPEYGLSAADAERGFDDISDLIARVGQRNAAKALGTTPALLKRVQPGTVLRHISDRLQGAARLFDRLSSKRNSELWELRDMVERDGLRATARRLGLDPSNLRRRVLGRHRCISGSNVSCPKEALPRTTSFGQLLTYERHQSIVSLTVHAQWILLESAKAIEAPVIRGSGISVAIIAKPPPLDKWAAMSFRSQIVPSAKCIFSKPAGSS